MAMASAGPSFVRSIALSCPDWKASADLATVLTEEVASGDSDDGGDQPLRAAEPVVLTCTRPSPAEQAALAAGEASASGAAPGAAASPLRPSLAEPCTAEVTIRFATPCRLAWIQLLQTPSRIQETYADGEYVATVRGEPLDDYEDPDASEGGEMAAHHDEAAWYLSTIEFGDSHLHRRISACTIKLLSTSKAREITIASIVVAVSATSQHDVAQGAREGGVPHAAGKHEAGSGALGERRRSEASMHAASARGAAPARRSSALWDEADEQEARQSQQRQILGMGAGGLSAAAVAAASAALSAGGPSSSASPVDITSLLARLAIEQNQLGAIPTQVDALRAVTADARSMSAASIAGLERRIDDVAERLESRMARIEAALQQVVSLLSARHAE
ncbi:condensin complex non-SMC subunit Cnd1 [Polyrhizophydium stewartii]|uniref:Condensin complex non-SMC subunit Cnd1 n=1 Tax=Polyrhizophydium stewartii TaxID=2732419 RepID=A0ABR4N428_9FUNG|nr:hypothetical protein HK105_003019 [Polyrhizophydium stewartii]